MRKAWILLDLLIVGACFVGVGLLTNENVGVLLIMAVFGLWNYIDGQVRPKL